METSSAYDAFGAGVTLTVGGQGDPFSPVGFGGQHGYYHGYTTGLYLLTHRYYDAGAGRFVTRDPIGYGGGMNLYGYADGNPVNESDPDGFDPRRKRMSVGEVLATAFSYKAFFGGPIFQPAYTDRHGVLHPRLQITQGEVPGPVEAAEVVSAAGSASRTLIPSVMHTLDLSSSAWRRTQFAQKGLVYVLRDSETGELLKVGQTVASKYVGRFEKYVTAGVRNNRKLALDVFEASESMRGQIESQIRRSLGRSPRSFRSLPWDNTGRRLGRPGPGVP